MIKLFGLIIQTKAEYERDRIALFVKARELGFRAGETNERNKVWLLNSHINMDTRPPIDLLQEVWGGLYPRYPFLTVLFASGVKRTYPLLERLLEGDKENGYSANHSVEVSHGHSGVGCCED